VLLAFWLRSVIGDKLVGYPFITFFPVVVLTAFLGGTGPGVLCAVLSGLALWYFFIPPYQSFDLKWPGGPIQPVEKAAAQLEWSGSMLRATAAV